MPRLRLLPPDSGCPLLVPVALTHTRYPTLHVRDIWLVTHTLPSHISRTGYAPLPDCVTFTFYVVGLPLVGLDVEPVVVTLHVWLHRLYGYPAITLILRLHLFHYLLFAYD